MVYICFSNLLLYLLLYLPWPDIPRHEIVSATATNDGPPWVAKQAFQARICTIFHMREATYISDGIRMRACPRGPYKTLKTRIDFLLFFQYILFLFYLGALGAIKRDRRRLRELRPQTQAPKHPLHKAYRLRGWRC